MIDVRSKMELVKPVGLQNEKRIELEGQPKSIKCKGTSLLVVNAADDEVPFLRALQAVHKWYCENIRNLCGENKETSDGKSGRAEGPPYL